MEFTSDNINNDKELFTELLKCFTMFKIKCWWNKKERCSNCGKVTMIDVNILDTTYQEIIVTFVLNKILHPVGMLWIIDRH